MPDEAGLTEEDLATRRQEVPLDEGRGAATHLDEVAHAAGQGVRVGTAGRAIGDLRRDVPPLLLDQGGEARQAARAASTFGSHWIPEPFLRISSICNGVSRFR